MCATRSRDGPKKRSRSGAINTATTANLTQATDNVRAKEEKNKPNLTTGCVSMGNLRACAIRVVGLRPHPKNTLRAFIDLELTRVGLVLRDCTWHEKNGREWVSFPARSYSGEDDVQRWSPVVEFAEGAREARQQFQEQAL